MGMIFLLGGSASDLLAPLYIGYVITALEAGNMDEVKRICFHLAIIVVVSNL